MKDFLPKNQYSRPGRPLRDKKAIILHYTACPKATAKNIRDYFYRLKYGKYNLYASAHYIVGLRGEIIQAIPDTEMAYHVGANIYAPDILKFLNTRYPNDCTLGIEMCHKGPYKISWRTLFGVKRIVQLYPDLPILRHYDITQKICPKYYVDNPRKWDKLIKWLRSPGGFP